MEKPSDQPIAAVIQARMGSKRLRQKAMLNIGGKTILQIIVERLKKSQGIDEIILSTSLSQENEVLVAHAKAIGLKYHRGSENDLVSRHLGALRKTDALAMVRITADCPLVDPKIVDAMVKIYRKKNHRIDFITNCFPPTYPDGLDVDITPVRVLERIDREIAELRQQVAEVDASPEIMAKLQSLIKAKKKIEADQARLG